jgi:hypothetical protein
MFSNALAFRLVKDPDFVEFLQYINPSFKIPTRQAISDKYLSAEEARLQNKVKKHLQQQGSVVLVPDGSSDSCQEPITHIVVVPPDQNPCLYQVINHHTDKHTAENITTNLKAIMTTLHSNNITTQGILSDTENKMKSVHSLLKNDVGLIAAPGKY